jgi:hypothetical protein
LFPEAGSTLPFALPLSAALEGGPIASEQVLAAGKLHSEIVVANAVNEEFGHVTPLGRGEVWTLPGFEDNTKFVRMFVDRLAAVRRWRAPGSSQGSRDFFISHASEDKQAAARPIADMLIQKGFSVWLDEAELTLGDSLRAKIDLGLRSSHYAVVILSPSFFSKRWPQAELDGLLALEQDGRKRILPVCHAMSQRQVADYSPILSGRIAVETQSGIETVVEAVIRASRVGSIP